MIINVALAQLSFDQSIEKTIQKAFQTCREAQQNGADIILFPEMFLIGYQQEYMKSEYAYALTDQVIAQFGTLAKKLGVAIGITYLGKGKHKPTNTLTLFDRHGVAVLTYQKVHICDFEGGSERALESGDAFKVVQLDTRQGVVSVGAMICFDRELPESARALMLKGAEIILVPNACHVATDPVLGDVRLAQLRSRAFENMVGIALANYPQSQADGHSAAFFVDGKQLVTADQEETILYAQFDMQALREWRKKESWGGVCRKPDVYDIG